MYRNEPKSFESIGGFGTFHICYHDYNPRSRDTKWEYNGLKLGGTIGERKRGER